MENIEHILTVKISEIEPPSDERESEKPKQDEEIAVLKQDVTSNINQAEEEDDEEESPSSASTVVSCIRRPSSSDFEEPPEVQVPGRTRRWMRIGQRARARRLSKARNIYAPNRKYIKRPTRKAKVGRRRDEKISQGFSTDESGEDTDQEVGEECWENQGEGSSGIRKEPMVKYTLLETDDSSSSADAAYKSS